MVWLETPTNPLMKITDIKAIADILKSRPDIILVVDNTFLTCYYQVSLIFSILSNKFSIFRKISLNCIQYESAIHIQFIIYYTIYYYI